MSNLGEDVEKLEHWYIASENIKQYSGCGKQNCASSDQLKIKLSYILATQLLGMYLEQLKAETQTEEGVVAHVCNLSTLET
jgi:hypothetical protein